MNTLADAALAHWLEGLPRGDGMEGMTDRERLQLLRRPRSRPTGPALAQVRDLTVPGPLPVPARLYRAGSTPCPVTVFVHGGAFVTGGLDSHDRLCRRLALLSDTAVLAVDYRLAPEHPAPAAVDDVVQAVQWAASAPQELGPLQAGRAGLAGDSAGGLIAFLAAAALTGSPAQPEVLFLAYPNADLSLSQPSVRDKADGWGLSVPELAWCIGQWVRDCPPQALAQLSPVRVADVRPLPVRTLLATAEHDPLCDEGKMLADQLVRNGTSVEFVPHPGLVHGFLTLDTVSAAAERAGDTLMRDYGQMLCGR